MHSDTVKFISEYYLASRIQGMELFWRTKYKQNVYRTNKHKVTSYR